MDSDPFSALSDSQRLNRIHALLESKAFTRDSPDDGPWKVPFAELIVLLDALLLQSEREGRRIDFYEGVGVNGKIQDITSLVHWLRACLPANLREPEKEIPFSRMNRYFDRGFGHFDNGTFFTVEFDGELAFFIDDQRIYLNRHLRRATADATAYLHKELPFQMRKIL